MTNRTSLVAGIAAVQLPKGGVLAGIARGIAGYWTERKLRRAVIDLHNQDDFVLLDMGIRRVDIDAVVRHGRSAVEAVERYRHHR